MGANFQTVTVDEEDEKKLHKWFANYQKELTYEYGHDTYNGTMSNSHGLSVDTSKMFKTEDEAHDYIIDKTEKWGAALAVRVFMPTRKFVSTTKGIAMIARIEEIKVAERAITKNRGYNDYEKDPAYKEINQKHRKMLEDIRVATEKYRDAQFKAKTKRAKHFVYCIGAWCAE